MKEIVGYIKNFSRSISQPVWLTISLFTAILIYLDFHWQMHQVINNRVSFYEKFYLRYLLFLAAFAIPYSLYLFLGIKNYFKNTRLSFIILIAPAFYALKMALPLSFHFSQEINWNRYWNQVFNWPVHLIEMSIFLLICWKLFFPSETLVGWPGKNFRLKPYLILLAMALPLVAAASLQPDFLSMYPKVNQFRYVIDTTRHPVFYKILFELAYGMDFISVELFFRGFLVLALVRIAGKDAILPMAAFYCAIHFGKPLAECISSYFGGILMGIMVYYTRTIGGVIIVHLGLAWLMEACAAMSLGLSDFFHSTL